MTTCAQCQITFTITVADRDFYKKLDVPPPTRCPRCRTIRRFIFRNLRALYKRPVIGSDNQPVLCGIAPESPLTVYTHEKWNSDTWEALDYGRDFDFSRPFFPQFAELFRAVPWPAILNLHVENSDFCHQVSHLKNCYLLFNSGFAENCFYSTNLLKSKECLDCLNVTDCELSYELVDCEKCYGCMFLQNSKNCTNVSFSSNLIDCQDCFGCVNLRHKRFYFFNEPLSETEYRQKLSTINTASFSELETIKERFQKLRLEHPVNFMHGSHNEDVSGDYIEHSKNTKQSFMCRDLENCSYSQLVLFGPSKDSYDISVAVGDLCYELMESGGYNVHFSWRNIPKNLATGAINLDNLDYTIHCTNVSDLFACVGVRNKQYCIFNKQYSESDYKKLRERIIEHMKKTGEYGEFFPPELSPFAYNETIAQEYFPLTREQALEQGYRWRDEQQKTFPEAARPQELPDILPNDTTSLTNQLITCAHDSPCSHQCTVAFRLIESELIFYHRQNLPIPRLCPNCRHYARLAQQNPLELHYRRCMNQGCENEFETSYAPGRPEIVYCESCYNQTIF